ncbi:MAG: recombination protein RecR [Synergistaceae bacterium]|nr:recombination protein RecR [Synergistaceae bacterium]
MRKLPGIGPKGARRIAYYLLRKDEEYLAELGALFTDLRKGLYTCSECGNVSEHNPCSICSDPLRDREIICIVDDIESISTFEDAGVYNGLYHILGGSDSPLSGQELTEENIDFLLEHINSVNAEEVIIATNPKVEGDMTYYALLDVLGRSGVKKVTRIAYGLPFGGHIALADRMTLHEALEARREVL